MYSNNNKDNKLYDELIEKTIICFMLNDSKSIDEILYLTENDYFYSRKYRLLYSAIKDLYLEKRDIDIVSVRNYILKKDKDELHYAGVTDENQINVKFFTDITNMSTIINYNNIKQFCLSLKELYLRRIVKKKCEMIIIDSINQSNDIFDVIGNAQQQFYELLEHNIDNSFEYLNQIIPKVLDNINEESKIKGNRIGILSGFKSLDKIINGFQKQRLILVCSKPGIGKTSFAINLACNMSKDNKIVAIFTLENSGVPLIQKFLSLESVIEIDRLKIGQLSNTEWDRLLNACIEINNNNIIIDGNTYLNTIKLKYKCLKLKKEGKLDCIIIDYIQLMHSVSPTYYAKKYYNREEEINCLLTELKNIAIELDVPIIALAQSHRTNKYNDCYSMQIADIVLSLEKKYKKIDNKKKNKGTNHAKDELTLKILRNKMGETGNIQLLFDKEIGKFYEIELNNFDNPFE